MIKEIFKAYDIRGKYPREINEKSVFEIVTALRGYFGAKAKIVVGYDARLSSPVLYKTIFEGLTYSNVLKNTRIRKIKVIEAKMITTPMLYFLVNKLKADGGIMVTASHNPKNFNGLKVVGKNAKPISGLEILKLVSSIKH